MVKKAIFSLKAKKSNSLLVETAISSGKESNFLLKSKGKQFPTRGDNNFIWQGKQSSPYKQTKAISVNGDNNFIWKESNFLRGRQFPPVGTTISYGMESKFLPKCKGAISASRDNFTW